MFDGLLYFLIILFLIILFLVMILNNLYNMILQIALFESLTVHKPTHTHTHTRTHARTHTHTHTVAVQRRLRCSVEADRRLITLT